MVVGIVVVTMLAASLIWVGIIRNPYPCNTSKGVGIGSPVDSALAEAKAGDAPPTSLPSSEADALRRLSSSGAPPMSKEPIPSDGWIPIKGRWVHDLSDGTFYQVKLTGTDNGWRVDDYRLCSRERSEPTSPG